MFSLLSLDRKGGIAILIDGRDARIGAGDSIMGTASLTALGLPLSVSLRSSRRSILQIGFIVFASALGAAFPAFAADAVVEEVVVVDSAYNWSGVYLGAQAGYSFSGNADYIYDQDPVSSYNYQHDLDGALAGAYVG